MGRTGSTVRRAPWWLTASVYGGGVLTGVLLVALLGVGTPDFQAYRESAGAPPPASSPLPLQGSAEVNAACLRVINSAQDVETVLGGVEQARSDVDLQLLDDLVRQLQPIEARLERDLRDCRVTAATGPVTPGPTPTGATPTGPTPTDATPTGPSPGTEPTPGPTPGPSLLTSPGPTSTTTTGPP